jgi:origin recognition complex subunit 3
MNSVITADPVFGSSFLTELTNQLEPPEDAPDSLFSQTTFVTHLHPPDCGNISSAMKSIVNGFVEKETTLGKSTFYSIFAVEF